MGEAVAQVQEFRSRGISMCKLLRWSDIGRRSYYYKPSGNRKGVLPGTHSRMEDGTVFENAVVVEAITDTLNQEFCCYGYHNMNSELKDLGWIINHKKVDRLAKQMKLLYGRRIRPQPFKRNFIHLEPLDPIAHFNICLWISNIIMCASSRTDNVYY